MNKRLTALRSEHDKIRSAIESIENTAAEAGRDIDDSEAAELDTLSTRSVALASTIAEIATRDDSLRATSDILARFDKPADRQSGAVGAPDMTPGEYAVLALRSWRGDSEAVETLARVRAAAAGTLVRANETLLSDIAGIIPTTIVGDLTSFVDASRPCVSAMRKLPMPSAGSAFTRPVVTQHVQSGVQGAQLDPLTRRKMTIVGTSVSKSTHGGSAVLSEQDIDWSDPSIYDIVLQDLADFYAIDTEATAAAAIEAKVTSNVVTGSFSDPHDFFRGLATAAAAVYGTCKRLPDTYFAAVDVWAELVAMTDDDGRQLFPNLSPVNAGGQLSVMSFDGNPLGLKLVVSPEFSEGFEALGSAFYLEAFEQNKGAAQLAQPTTLEVELAYRGYFATNVRAQGLCGIEEGS